MQKCTFELLVQLLRVNSATSSRLALWTVFYLLNFGLFISLAFLGRICPRTARWTAQHLLLTTLLWQKALVIVDLVIHKSQLIIITKGGSATELLFGAMREIYRARGILAVLA